MAVHKKLSRAIEFTALTLPAVLAITVVVLVPFGMSILYSFSKWNGLDKVPVFNGVANYIELFTNDPALFAALGFTLLFTVCLVVFVNLIALGLALALDQPILGKNALRAAFYVPNIISLIIIGYVWRFIFSKGFETFHQMTGWPMFDLSWLGDPYLAFVSTVLVSLWHAIGFYLVIYLAGLQTIPRDLIEASMIDGARPFQRFTKITLPLLMPSVTVCVFYALSNGLKTFDVILSLTNGGPGNATTSIALNIYNAAFGQGRFGYGMAMSVLLFLLILGITLFQVTVFKNKEVES